MSFTLPDLPYAYDALNPYMRGKRLSITTTSITLPMSIMATIS